MLSANNNGVAVEPGLNNEMNIVTWTANGEDLFLGFMGTGTYSAMFKLYIKGAISVPELAPEDPGTCIYVYQTSPSNRTAYVVDRLEKLEVGTTVSLRVYHESASAETFYGTILGGSN